MDNWCCSVFTKNCTIFTWKDVFCGWLILTAWCIYKCHIVFSVYKTCCQKEVGQSCPKYSPDSGLPGCSEPLLRRRQFGCFVSFASYQFRAFTASLYHFDSPRWSEGGQKSCPRVSLGLVRLTSRCKKKIKNCNCNRMWIFNLCLKTLFLSLIEAWSLQHGIPVRHDSGRSGAWWIGLVRQRMHVVRALVLVEIFFWPKFYHCVYIIELSGCAACLP